VGYVTVNLNTFDKQSIAHRTNVKQASNQSRVKQHSNWSRTKVVTTAFLLLLLLLLVYLQYTSTVEVSCIRMSNCSAFYCIKRRPFHSESIFNFHCL